MIASPRNNWMIDGVQPVDRLCPLNRGLVAWWLGIPGWTGGRRFIDIVSPGPNGAHGTLINTDPALAWVPSPGGAGAVALDEYIDDAILAPVVLPTANDSDCSVLVWFKPTISKQYHFLFCESPNPTTGTYLRHAVYLSNSQQKLTYDNYLPSGGTTTSNAFSTVFNKWTALGFVRRSDVVTLYFNGRPIGGGACDTYTGTAPVNVILGGRKTATNAYNAGGEITDIRVHDRALLASEVKAVYLDSLQGYPRTLRRVGRTIFAAAVVAPAAGTVNPLIMGTINLLHGKVG